MIITKLQGGLGNQMFQYAAGLVLAERLHTKLHIDTGFLKYIEASDHGTTRFYELSAFGIQPRDLSLADKLRLKVQPPTVLRDQDLSYKPEFRSVTGNVVLEGFWQSYKYFTGYRQKIVSTFAFPPSISQANSQHLETIKNSQSVSVHIRRGDYVTDKETKKFHNLLPMSYYQAAVKRLETGSKKLNYYVFSDDPTWCKQHMPFLKGAIFVDNNKADNGVEDMRLMAACQHNIIANSSFSWWGAWLSQRQKKKVIAPKKWFQSWQESLDDRLPPDWIRL